MALTLAEQAGQAEAAIRKYLTEGASRDARNRAMRAVQAELADICRERPEDAALIDAELAARLFVLAYRLRAYQPKRPWGVRPDLDGVFTKAVKKFAETPAGRLP